MSNAMTVLPYARSGVPTPPGYDVYGVVDPFEAYFGPIFRRVAPPLRYAMVLDERHLNFLGAVHGGVLCTLADAALGAAAWETLGRVPVVTVDLQLSFQRGGAKLGSLVEVTPQITRRGRRLLFIRGDITVGEELIAAATSVWSVIDK